MYKLVDKIGNIINIMGIILIILIDLHEMYKPIYIFLWIIISFTLITNRVIQYIIYKDKENGDETNENSDSGYFRREETVYKERY